VLEVGGLDSDPVHKGSVSRAKIAEKTLGRSDLEDTVMARKKTIVRQAKLSILASPDHECIVLIKCEVASGLRPGHDV
jgi:hypothetical protein